MNFLASFFFIFYSVCQFASYIPQIKKLIRTKKADDISIGSWSIWLASSCSYFGYIALSSPDNVGLLVLSAIDIVFIYTTFSLAKYYQSFGNDTE